MNNRYDWIIATCSSEATGVSICRFRGSIEETKEKLVSLILGDKNMADEDSWCCGSETIDEIDAVDNGVGFELCGYATYNNFHIEYTAKEFSHIEFLT